jgi:PAS domain S-box-containing protein
MAQSPTPQQTEGILGRIHQFGIATERLFSRLYRGLNQRTKEEVNHHAQKQQELDKRNRQLRRLLRNTGMKVERLEQILEAISEGIILQELNGRIALVNRAAKELIGSDRNLWHSDIVGLFAQHNADVPLNRELVPLGQPHRVQIQGRIIGAQVMALSDDRGERLGTLIILSDITRDELDARLKKSFVTHISHELRTPIAPLRMANEMLINAPTDKAPNRRMLELMSRNIDILDRMVNEMIDISAMSSGAFTIQQDMLYLEPMLYDIVDEFKEDIKEAKLELQIFFKHVDSLIVTGDEKFIRWAISNLVRNAIQYNQANQKIWIRAGLSNDSDTPSVVIQVADSGVGISSEDMPHIFDLFYRGTPRNRQGKLVDPRGLGQGLYVARMITTAHGGSLIGESKQFEGSLFTLRLPMAVSQSLLPPTEANF